MVSPARAAALIWIAAAAATGCAYYNSMWSAERFARRARGLENQGHVNEARGFWLQASVKAESVLARHHRSRWADDALVLRLEGLVRGGDCGTADVYAARARAAVLSEPLRQRTDLALAECALERGRPGAAGGLAAGSLDAHDPVLRARAAWVAARAAWDRGDAETALTLYARSTHPDAGPARLHGLLATGRDSAALVLFDSLTAQRFREEAWTAMVQDLAATLGPERTSHALTAALGRTRVPYSARLRFLLADGDRLLAAGVIAPAVARYGEIVASGVEGNETALARVRLLRAAAQQSESVAALQPVREALRRYLAAYPGGGGAGEAQALLTLIERITDTESGEAPEFLAVELARDTLRALALAGHRFVEFATRHPESLFAPKALVAALPLLPESGDSLRAALQGRYADSPYALALQGELSPAYAAAEDSLAKDLGVARQQDGDVRSLVAPPMPGRRGPWLEQVLPAGREPPPLSPGATPPRRLRPGERPVQRP